MIFVQRCIACVSTESKFSLSMSWNTKFVFLPKRKKHIEREIYIPKHKMLFMDLFFCSVWYDLTQASKSTLVFSASYPIVKRVYEQLVLKTGKSDSWPHEKMFFERHSKLVEAFSGKLRLQMSEFL